MKRENVLRFMGVLVLLIVGLSGCVTETETAGDSAATRSGKLELRIEQLLSGMNLEQKIAQMIQAEIKYVTPQDIRQYGLGSVLNGGGSFPGNDRRASVGQWLALADTYFEASVDTSSGSAGIPIIWGTDAVHGHNNVFGATLFPHNIGLGASNNPQLLAEVGRITALEVAATGIDWIFAPTVAVVKDERWGRTYEGYSDRPDIIARYAPRIVEAIQDQGVIATAKHFIGDGGTHRGVDQGDTRMQLDALLEEHGQGYVTAIDAGVMTVMASFNSWNGDKIHGNRQLLTDVLKGEMGFDGFVVSDWNGIGQVEGCSNDSCPQAINAGIDMVMAPDDWRSLHRNMLREVEQGLIPMERIDDAVRRILRVKLKAGLLDAPKPSLRAAARKSLLGAPEHRAVARQAVRESLVLLKNNGGLLPLQPQQTVLVAGSGADHIGMQNGGWTISWQGTGNSNEDFPAGSSIYDGIRQVVEAAGGEVALSVAGDYRQKPDVAVVVFGETPYAEGQGDVRSLAWQQGYKYDQKLLRRLNDEGIPVVAIFLTGRPLWVNAELNASDAFVVAWLPGSEGTGVADVLFANAQGNARYDFVGRLAFDWPNIDLNPADHDASVADTLFPYGYGLDYSSNQQLADNLNELPVGEAASVDKVVFRRGTKAPWRVLLGDEGNWSKPVTGNRAESASGQLSVAAVDYQVQEDARRLEWRGSGDSGQIFWQSDSPVDFTQLRELNGALSLHLKVDEMPAGKVTLRMDCGWPCSGAIDLTSTLSGFRAGDWVRLSIPLACLESAGADLGKINTPLVLASSARFAMTLSEVSVLARPPVGSLMACES